MVCGGKKGCPRERNLREIYTENTMFCLLSVFLCWFYLHITEYEQIRGAQNFLRPRGVKYLNAGLNIVTKVNLCGQAQACEKRLLPEI
jgi:hypothetical protein